VSEAYKVNGIELVDMAIEVKSLANAAKLFGHVLGIASLGAIENEHCPIMKGHLVTSAMSDGLKRI
jgi:hypothetical protein